MPYCNQCGKKIPEGAKFCGVCGAAVQGTYHEDTSLTSHTLVVSRDSQLLYFAMSYDVIVDGLNIGNLPMGQSLAVKVFSDVVRVHIKCTNFMMKKFKVELLLRLNKNPRVSFSLTYPGKINYNVTGADILSVYY